jgi:ribosomal protein S18 acetylase RimI-like enzyme
MFDDYTEVIKYHQVFVVEANGIVRVLLLIQTVTGILLDNVAVHPDRQGSGIGKRLMNLAESEAKDQSFEKLDIYTHECMYENIALYKALEPVGLNRS